MRKIMLSLCLVFSLAMFACADTYTVALSTYLPTIEDPAASWPNIAGPAYIGEIIITNSGDTVQTVTFYKLSKSSLTATTVAVAVVATTGTVKIDLEGEAYTDLGIIKSDTGTTVNITVKYQ